MQATNDAYRRRHPDRLKRRWKDWYSKNVERRDEYSRQRRKTHPNLEAARKRNARYAKAHPEKQRENYRKNSAKVKARSAARYAANRESELKKMAARYAADPVPKREQTRAWARANPDKRRENIRTASCKRRAHARGAGGRGVTRTEWEAIAAWHDHRCAYCFALPKKLTRDHVVPLVSGGPDEAENVVPACPFCNASKGKKELREWLGLKNDRRPNSATEGLVASDRIPGDGIKGLRLSA